MGLVINMNDKNIKKTPKWYLVSSIVIVCIAMLLIILESLISTFIPLSGFGLLLLIVWMLLSFIMLIYFLAKKYTGSSLILPILFIIEFLFTIPVRFYADQSIIYFKIIWLTSLGLVSLIFTIGIISVSLYLLWRE